MEIIISNSSDKPIYEQIAMQIKSLIMNGTLSAGEALPSMRALAKDLHISVITTITYDNFHSNFLSPPSDICVLIRYVQCI